jgi:O-antigen ligase
MVAMEKVPQKVKKYDYLIISLFLLLPFSLVLGSFLSDLTATIYALGFLIYIIKKKNFKYLNNNYFYYFLVIYIYLNINSFFSFNPILSFERSTTYIRMILFSLCVSFLLKNISDLNKFFFISIISCLIILFVDSLFQFFTGFNLVGYVAEERISSFFEKKLVLGSFVTRILPILFGLIFILEIKYKKYIGFFIVFISGVLVFLSAERLAFAYFSITIFFFLLFFFNNKEKIILISFLLISFGALTTVSSRFYDRIFLHTISQLKEGKSFLSISYRHELHFITAYNMYLDSKLIGHGLRSFRHLCDSIKYNPLDKISNDNTKRSSVNGIVTIDEIKPTVDERVYYKLFIISQDGSILEQYKVTGDYIKIFVKNGDVVRSGDNLFSSYPYASGCNTHPHNFYLHLLSETGIIGFMFFFLLFLFFLYNLILNFYKIIKIRENKVNKMNFFFLLGLCLSLFPLFPSGSFYNNWLLVLFYLNLGFFINYYSLIKK